MVIIPVATGYGLATLDAARHHGHRTVELRRLEKSSTELASQLEQERTEAERLSRIAEQRCDELEERLRIQQSKLDQAWSKLGALPRPRPVPRIPMASRGGRTRRTHLMRQRLRGIEVSLAANRKDLRAFESAASAHCRAESRRRSRCTPAGPPCASEMTSGFGPRLHPVYGRARQHNGCDFTAPEGTAVKATGDGVVVHSDWLGGYGRVVEIDHGYDLHSLYAHCAQVKVVKGQRVRRGECIATVGMTGLASGPHCHYEVRSQGVPLNPRPYLAASGRSVWVRLSGFVSLAHWAWHSPKRGAAVLAQGFGVFAAPHLR